jgi:hypothetical protein
LSRSVSRPRKFGALTHTVDRHLFEKSIGGYGPPALTNRVPVFGIALFHSRRTVKPHPLDDRSGSRAVKLAMSIYGPDVPARQGISPKRNQAIIHGGKENEMSLIVAAG